MTEVIDRPTVDQLPTRTTSRSVQFSARQAPWMKLGKVIDAPVTSAEAATLGCLDFEVDLIDVGWRSGGALTEDVTWKTISGRKAVVRRDTGDVFDVVSDDYRPVQYAQAFEFMDEVSPHYVAAGTLRGGRQGFMVVQRPDLHTLDLDLDGTSDPHELFVVLRTSHDRSRGLEVALMPLRGRCMNQLPLAGFTFSAEQRWSVRHVGEPMKKLSAARRVFANVAVYAREFEETARRLVETDVLVDEVEELLRGVLPDRPRRDLQVNGIVAAWRESPYVGFRNNGWGLVNAVGEYFEWQRESAVRTDQSRFISGLDGATSRYVNRTAQLLLRRG